MVSEEFRLMEAADPDGKDQQPTEEDYLAFRDWAIAKFGRHAYETYMRGEYNEPEEV